MCFLRSVRGLHGTQGLEAGVEAVCLSLLCTMRPGAGSSSVLLSKDSNAALKRHYLVFSGKNALRVNSRQTACRNWVKMFL